MKKQLKQENAENLLSISSTRRIVDFSKAFAGHLPGALPIAAIFARIIFAAVSGSFPAIVATIGSLMFEAAVGYRRTYAVGNYCFWKFGYLSCFTLIFSYFCSISFFNFNLYFDFYYFILVYYLN